MGDNYVMLYDLKGATVKMFCLANHVLRGSPLAYCNGRTWDRRLGVCHPSTQDNSWCDFETEDLCGWVHDENCDFQWSRRSGLPMTLRQKTGPRADHTVGRLYEGHYMIVESFDRDPGDTTRLISPVYEIEKFRNGCFRFYYHMFGLFVGYLQVYVKPQSMTVAQVKIDSQFRRFQIFGNRGNLWHEAMVSLANVTENFQIIFEGKLL